MLAAKNPYIESAYEQLKLISQDEQKRLEYEAIEKAIRDYNQMMFEAEQRGRESGRESGIEEGRKLEAMRINKLNTFLLQNKRYADLERAANDIGFQQQLMFEYDI